MEKSPKMEQVESLDPKAVGLPSLLSLLSVRVGGNGPGTHLPPPLGPGRPWEGRLAGKETRRKEGNMMWEGCGQEVTIPGV
jgi:hypothetical protein